MASDFWSGPFGVSVSSELWTLLSMGEGTARCPPGGVYATYVLFLKWLLWDFVHFLCDGGRCSEGR
jgi:hypothetical protein